MKKIALILSLIIIFTMCLSACGPKEEAPAGGAAGTAGTAGTEAPPTVGTEVGGQQVIIDAVEETMYERITEDGTLTVGVTTSTGNFDPRYSYNLAGEILVYDTLFKRNNVTDEIEPCLVETYEYLDDCHLRLTLRDNVYFSNGEKLTTEDVLFSLERCVGERANWINYYNTYDFENTVIEDELTMVLATKAPYGPGLAYLCLPYASIVCKAYVESTDDEAFWDKPVGTGPYVCKENISGSHSVYTVRDDYWGETPAYHTITVRNYAESATMYIDYENGVLDMAIGIASEDMMRVYNGEVEHTNLSLEPGLSMYTLCFPEYTECFQDVRVREAFAHAIDCDALGYVGFGDLYAPAISMVPNGLDYQINVGTYEYNPELAVSLLADAGYSAGDITLKLVIVNSESNVRMAEAIQAYLGEVGVQVNVEAYDKSVAVPMFQRGETDIVINMMTCVSRDPDQAFNTCKKTTQNLSSRITDETMNEYLFTGRDSTDPATRQEAYENAQVWMYENIRQVPICYDVIAVVYRDYIESANIVTAGCPDLRGVIFK